MALQPMSPIGQDATISYGYLDLKFENNTGYPIYIEAWMDDPELHVNIYGFHPEEWDEIKVTSQTTAAYEPDATIYKNTDSLPAGTTQEDVTPRTGYSASGQKEFYKDGKIGGYIPNLFFVLRTGDRRCAGRHRLMGGPLC